MKKSLLFIFSLCISLALNAQVSKTVNVTPPLGLYSSLTQSELNTVTNLTITGTIDATDFVVLRDNMPVLSVLDLSAVTIIAYSGKGGTSEYPTTYDTVYAANVIPQFAFCDSTINHNGKKSLTSVILPSTIISVGFSAFCNCSGITSISFPSNVKSIEPYAFRYCNGIKSVSIPSTIDSIGLCAFTSNCAINVDANNLKYSSVNGILFNKNKTILHQCPSTITGVFIVPSTVTTIDDCAFYNCLGLTSITIPSLVSNLYEAYGTFKNCNALINVDSLNAKYSSVGGVLFDKTQATLLYFPISITGNYTVPSSVQSINDASFRGCNLTSITVPSTVSYIGSEAFQNSKLLKNISIPSSILYQNLGFEFLNGCTSLQTIYNYATTPQYTGEQGPFNDEFEGIDTNKCILNVPFGTSNAYKLAYEWSSFQNIKEMIGISFSKTIVYIADTLGSTGSVIIKSNTTFTATSNQTWLNINPDTSITGNITLTYTAKANTFSSTRIAKITIKGIGINDQTITVYQQAIVLKLTISSDSVIIAKEANSSSIINVKTNTKWKAISNQAWLIITPDSSNSNSAITFTANSANTTSIKRSAIVTLSATGLISKTITVIQEAEIPYLAVSSNSVSLSNQANSTATINVTSNTKWIASSDQSWLSINPDSIITGNNPIILTATENQTGTNRTATIAISGIGTKTQSISVIQGTSSIVLLVSSDTVTLTNQANSSSSVNITSNTTWTASTDKTWLKINPTIATNGNATLSLIATANTTISSRLATVTITANNVNETISITQDAGDTTLSVSANTVNLTKGANSSSSVDITSNTTWTAISNQAWLTVSPSISTTGNATISFTASANTMNTIRKATITISANGITSQTVTITQDANIATLTLSTSNIILTNNSTTVDIKSNTSWTASSDASWLSVNPNTIVYGNDTVTITTTTNPTTSDRTGTISILTSDSTIKTIYITQAGSTPSLNITSDTASLSNKAGSFTTIDVISNTTWVAGSDQSWLIVYPNTQTSGSGKLSFTALGNTGNTRSATVTIVANGITQTFTITQLADNSTLIKDISKDTIIIYPNPATSSFKINMDCEALVQVYTLGGELVLSKKISEKEIISSNNIPAGVYIVKIITRESNTTQSLIVK